MLPQSISRKPIFDPFPIPHALHLQHNNAPSLFYPDLPRTHRSSSALERTGTNTAPQPARSATATATAKPQRAMRGTLCHTCMECGPVR